MSEQKKKKLKPIRQDWNPHWTLRLLYRIWMILFSAFKVAVGAAVTVLLIGVVCAFVFVGILGDYLQEDILPMANMEIEDVELDEPSTMYYVDENGDIQVYQNIFAATSSKWADLEDIPKDLIHAAVAIEDHRFYEHQGVDWVTTIKACARMFFGDDSVGGSSITQQLIKNLLLLDEDETADDVTVQRKVLEIFRALQVEKKYHKDTIMEMYLNCIYLGQGCRGVRSAAEAYFGKELELLTTAECASLISITNSPTYYDPYQNFDNNKERKEDVLWAMKDYGWLEEDEYEEAIAQELVLKPGVDKEDRLASCGSETCDYRGMVKTYRTEDGENYYCPQCGELTAVLKNASKSVYSYFADTVLEDVGKAFAEQSGMKWNSGTREVIMQQIQKGGYHIYTTIDKRVQDQVDAIYTNLDEIPDTRGGQQLQSAMIVVDNRTGDIVAMAGGVGEKTEHDGWNRATDSELQSGSSIKPLTVYAPAFESGAITPATVIDDMPLYYENERSPYPRNDTRTYSYARTIYRAVVRSVNAAAAQTLDKSGANYAFKFATEKFRLSTLIESYVDSDGEVHSDIGTGPLAMGAQTFGVTVRDMASAFATFANDGVYREGRTFTKVYDSEGNVVIDNTQESEQILSQKTVDYMNYCLVAATAEGTGYDANLSWSHGITTAGKTGTTGDSKDRWYCGFTGYYTAAVWSGFDDPEVIYSDGNPSAQLWKKVMGPLHEGKSNISLYDRNNFWSAEMCLSSGKKATEACKADIRLDAPIQPGDFIVTSTAAVYPEDFPQDSCDKHVLVDYCSCGGVATEWCQKFAGVDPTVTITQKGLVRLTQEEINEILKAENSGMYKDYLRNDYVYFINNDGTDGVFKGVKNDLQQEVEAPYLVCPVHTQKAWEEYEAANQPPVPEETVTPPATGGAVMP